MILTRLSHMQQCFMRLAILQKGVVKLMNRFGLLRLSVAKNCWYQLVALPAVVWLHKVRNELLRCFVLTAGNGSQDLREISNVWLLHVLLVGSYILRIVGDIIGKWIFLFISSLTPTHISSGHLFKTNCSMCYIKKKSYWTMEQKLLL